MLKGLKNFLRARRTARRTAGSPQKPQAESAPHVTDNVVIETREPGKDWEVIEEDHNLVVTQAEGLMAQMLIGTVSADINYIELGDQVSPTVPQLADTGLENTTGQNKVTSKVIVGTNTAKFQGIWLVGEGNGFVYTEMGLFVGTPGSGTMFARKLFDNAVTKTTAFEMRITWYITCRVRDTGAACASVSFVGPSSFANYTVYDSPAGGEASIAADFDFTVGSRLLKVYLNGLKLIGSGPGVLNPKYSESATLTAPVGGTPTNKGINLIGFTANLGDRFELELVALT